MSEAAVTQSILHGVYIGRAGVLRFRLFVSSACLAQFAVKATALILGARHGFPRRVRS